MSRLPVIQPYSGKNAMFLKINRFGNKEQQEEDYERDEKDKKHEKELIARLETSFELEYEDLQVKPTTGKSAAKEYFAHYKQLGRVSQQNEFKSLKGSVQTSMLLRSEEVFGLPCRIGLIKTSGDESRVHLRNQKYGDKYASILSEGLKHTANVRDFWLANNRIKESGATQLLTAIAKSARAIDLKQNQIGRLGVDAICRALTPKDCK